MPNRGQGAGRGQSSRGTASGTRRVTRSTAVDSPDNDTPDTPVVSDVDTPTSDSPVSPDSDILSQIEGCPPHLKNLFTFLINKVESLHPIYK